MTEFYFAAALFILLTMGQTAIIDVALMLAILAVFASVGFVNWRDTGND